MGVRMKARVESKDLGVDALRRHLKRLATLRVLVGIQGKEATERYPNGESVGQVAHWLHFGTDKMPKRPYIDHGIREIKEEAKRAAKRAVSDIIDRRAKTPEAALEKVGEAGAAAVRGAIDTSRSWAAPIAKSTAARKGHSQPLLDLGKQRDSVTYTIREGDKVLKAGE